MLSSVASVAPPAPAVDVAVHRLGTEARGEERGYENRVRYALNSGGGWVGDVIIADWRNIENNVASEVHVKSFKPKESRNGRMHPYFLAPVDP